LFVADHTDGLPSSRTERIQLPVTIIPQSGWTDGEISNIDKYSIALLTKATKQLEDKRDKLGQVDEQIATPIYDPYVLERLVEESEELRDDICQDNQNPEGSNL